MIRLIVADDHPLVLRGIEGLFDPAEFQVSLYADGAVAMEAIERGACDVAVLDIAMPGLSGIEILKRVRAGGLPVKIVLLTSSIDDDKLVGVLRERVDGLLLKEAAADVLVTCVRAVCRGEMWIDREPMARALKRLAAPPPARLTEREAEVAQLVALGLRNKEIAYRASISEGTVKMHLHKIYEKLGLGSRTELVLHLRDKGLR
jgi:two-component system nitrate/nitrite response regulator NarP